MAVWWCNRILSIVGCIKNGDESEYRAVMGNFVTWCEQNHLQLNVTKTKELVVDLKRAKSPVTPVSIHGVSVDIVEDYKYLGVYIDNKLDWTKNTEDLYKKGQSVSTFWGGWGPSTSAGQYWGCFMSLWWPVHSCLLSCAGAASWRQRTPIDSTNWCSRPGTSWGWSWVLWHRYRREGCCPSYIPSWTTSPTHSMTSCWNTGALSVQDWSHLDAPQSATGSHSFLHVTIKLFNSSLRAPDNLSQSNIALDFTPAINKSKPTLIMYTWLCNNTQRAITAKYSNLCNKQFHTVTIQHRNLTWPPWFNILVTDWKTLYGISWQLFEWKDFKLIRTVDMHINISFSRDLSTHSATRSTKPARSSPPAPCFVWNSVNPSPPAPFSLSADDFVTFFANVDYMSSSFPPPDTNNSILTPDLIFCVPVSCWLSPRDPGWVPDIHTPDPTTQRSWRLPSR